MSFSVRLDGRTLATFDSVEDTLARAMEIVHADADKQPEVLNAETGQPVAPGASAGSREDLGRKIGF